MVARLKLSRFLNFLVIHDVLTLKIIDQDDGICDSMETIRCGLAGAQRPSFCSLLLLSILIVVVLVALISRQGDLNDLESKADRSLQIPLRGLWRMGEKKRNLIHHCWIHLH